jgi:hypothetical protein
MERPAFEGSGRGTFGLLRIESLGKQNGNTTTNCE